MCAKFAATSTILKSVIRITASPPELPLRIFRKAGTAPLAASAKTASPKSKLFGSSDSPFAGCLIFLWRFICLKSFVIQCILYTETLPRQKVWFLMPGDAVNKRCAALRYGAFFSVSSRERGCRNQQRFFYVRCDVTPCR